MLPLNSNKTTIAIALLIKLISKEPAPTTVDLVKN